MSGKEAPSMLPEQRPDLLAIGARQGEVTQLQPRKKGEPSFPVSGGQGVEARLDLKKEHEPVSRSFVTGLAHNPGEPHLFGLQEQPHFLIRLATGTLVGGLPDRGLQLPTTRTPKPKIGLLRAFEEKHAILVIKHVE